MNPSWILRSNLFALLEILARLAGYSFDEFDWAAIETEVRRTDVEKDCWCDYAFPGTSPIEFRLAEDPGSSVIFIETRQEEALAPKVEIVLELAAERELGVISPWFHAAN